MIIQTHKDIEEKLNGFIKSNKIPNILFHGENGSGKKTILNNFLMNIYSKVENKKNYIMYVNCALGKGIKFIREELKFFARTNLNYKTNVKFKSIILLNADNLTVDAQSALRRCIELFSTTTRFFLIIENKSRILKPILSRFCDIHIPRPLIKNQITNLHKLKEIKMNITIEKKLMNQIKEVLEHIEKNDEDINEYILEKVHYLYIDGISGLDIINYIEKYTEDSLTKYRLLIYFDKIRENYKNEELLMMHILFIYLMRNEKDLENICNM